VRLSHEQLTNTPPLPDQPSHLPNPIPLRFIQSCSSRLLGARLLLLRRERGVSSLHSPKRGQASQRRISWQCDRIEAAMTDEDGTAFQNARGQCTREGLGSSQLREKSGTVARHGRQPRAAPVRRSAAWLSTGQVMASKDSVTLPVWGLVGKNISVSCRMGAEISWSRAGLAGRERCAWNWP